jgi:phage terminase large subunit GpA-like protein
VKGFDHGGVLVGSPTPVEITVRGRKLKRGGRLWPVAVGIAKSELYGWLRLEVPTEGAPPPGFCHFPQYPDEYFKQLTAEQLVAHKTRKGFMRFEWELIPGRQNHVLDARVYARAAAFLAGLDRLRESDWTQLEARLGGPPTPEAPTPASATPAPPTPDPPPPPPATPRPGWLRRPGSGWLKGDR